MTRAERAKLLSTAVTKLEEAAKLLTAAEEELAFPTSEQKTAAEDGEDGTLSSLRIWLG